MNLKFPFLLVALFLVQCSGVPDIAEGEQAGDRIEVPFPDLQQGEKIIKTPPMAFRWCPPGTYTMGTSPETVNQAKEFTRPYDNPNYHRFNGLYNPQHENQVSVTLTKGFYIGETEFTYSQWCALLWTYEPKVEKIDKWDVPKPTQNKELTPLKPEKGKRDSNNSEGEWPSDISRIRAGRVVDYLNLNHAPKGWKYRFPTSAEWEYACRAGGIHEGGHQYGWEESVNTLWNGTYGYSYLLPIGSKKPNAWGLYDMLGSYAEWTSDYITDYKVFRKSERSTEPLTDPVYEASGEYCILRGGHYNMFIDQLRTGAYYIRRVADDDHDIVRRNTTVRLVLSPIK